MTANHSPTTPTESEVTVTINGETRTLPAGTTLRETISETTGRQLHADGTAVDGQRLGIAVAVDATVIPRSRWSATWLRDGQNVEIITAMQGG
ncbi:sulfur carrier protein ThiS [Brevibacterium gallinarum]|uniref:sulfur carrier protein ThiS n=1 Tax=Brevibacterium gallinarum TaxID=2762220 RepID=UPI001CD8D932|nr:sulfur carrier protein ThiS [Brevibacterium gallinarum]